MIADPPHAPLPSQNRGGPAAPADAAGEEPLSVEIEVTIEDYIAATTKSLQNLGLLESVYRRYRRTYVKLLWMFVVLTGAFASAWYQAAVFPSAVQFDVPSGMLHGMIFGDRHVPPVPTPLCPIPAVASDHPPTSDDYHPE